MFVRSLLVAAVLVAFSAPASAYYCPLQAKTITAALDNFNLSAAQKAELEILRDQGMVQHNVGNHTAAVKALSEATRIILGGM